MILDRTPQHDAGEMDAVSVAPLLDDAISNLAESDRNALVLRYFSRCTLAEIGERLGVSPAAAEKRVSRAAERLRQSLVRGGVALSLMGLMQFLIDSGVSAAPAEIADKLSGAIAVDQSGIQITPSVELANRTLQAMKVVPIKLLFASAAALVVVSFISGVVLTYIVLNRSPAPASIPPAPIPASVVADRPKPDQSPLIDNAPIGNIQGQNPERVPFAPPENLVPAPGAHLNLLARLNLVADNLNGEWTQSPGVLRSGVHAFSLVQLPYIPPDEYDYHATFTVEHLRGEVVMLCARKGADFDWQMGARENRTTIFDIQPGYNVNNPSRHDVDAVLTEGVACNVTVQVRNNGVAAYMDGKLIGKLETDYAGFGAFQFWQLKNRAALGVGTWGTPTRFDRLEVVEVSGPGTWLRAEGQPAASRERPVMTDAAEWSKAVDLMPLIDPERDAVSGKWVRNNSDELVSDNASLARLEIPYQPPEEYDYKMIFTRNNGWDTVMQCFGHAHTTLGWGMAMWGNELNMFRCVSWFEGTNPTTVWAKEFIQNGKQYESIVQVRKQGYAAFIDGKLISFWDRGYKNGAHAPKEWKLPTPGLLGIGSSSSQTTFHSLQVLEITGTGSNLIPASPKRVEAPPVAKSPAVSPPKPPQEGF